MIEWTSYKKSINLISWLVLQNEPATFAWWHLPVFFVLKVTATPKYFNVQEDIFDFVYVHTSSKVLQGLESYFKIT